MNENTLVIADKNNSAPEHFSAPKKLDFITPTFMNVLEFFLADPMNEYYGREVSRKTGVSIGATNGILNLLTKLDFLTREKKGNLLIYKLNLREPSVKQFKILRNVFGIKELVSQLKPDCRKVVLFGSRAQGTDIKDSDIDLLIVTTQRELVRKTINAFNRKQERRIAPIIVDMNEYISLKKEDKPLYENIQRGIVLWEQE